MADIKVVRQQSLSLRCLETDMKTKTRNTVDQYYNSHISCYLCLIKFLVY